MARRRCTFPFLWGDAFACATEACADCKRCGSKQAPPLLAAAATSPATTTAATPYASLLTTGQQPVQPQTSEAEAEADTEEGDVLDAAGVEQGVDRNSLERMPMPFEVLHRSKKHHRPYPSPAPPPLPPPPLPSAEEGGRRSAALSISVVSTLLLCGLLLRHYMEQGQVTVITTAGACMLLGAVVNGLSWAVAFLLSSGDGHGPLGSMYSVNAGPELLHTSVHDIIYFGLLPPIIFEAGFVMRKRSFFANFITIMVYSVGGTLISVLFTAGTLYSLSVNGFITADFSFTECLLFGSIIAATDPVATLSTLKSSGTPPLLYDLIFGESALNDAFSIVLFNIFRTLCAEEWRAKRAQLHLDPHDSHPPPVLDPPWYEVVPPAMGRMSVDLLRILPLSLALGVGVGLFASAATNRLGMREQSRSHAELSLVLVTAMLSYTIADEAKLSGIYSLFFAGITMRHYAFYNLSGAAQATAGTLFATLSEMSDIAISLILGVAFFDYVAHGFLNQFRPIRLEAVEQPRHQWGGDAWDFALIGYSALALLAGRALNTFPLTSLANRCYRRASERIGCGMQAVMWWSGLRGPISFALAVTLVGSDADDEVMPAQRAQIMITTTLSIVIGTNLLLAPATAPLIRALKLSRAAPPAHEAGSGLGSTGLVPLLGSSELTLPDHGSQRELCAPLTSPIHGAWRILDQYYMKPLFGGRPDRGPTPPTSVSGRVSP